LTSIFKDISFFISNEDIIDDKWVNENDFYELIREMANDQIEKVELLDKFFHEKKQSHSKTFRITYSPNEPSLTNPAAFNDKVNSIQQNIRDMCGKKLNIQLR
jgi:phenylalanyl-tRNA synthetase alpha chain